MLGWSNRGGDPQQQQQQQQTFVAPSSQPPHDPYRASAADGPARANRLQQV